MRKTALHIFHLVSNDVKTHVSLADEDEIHIGSFHSFKAPVHFMFSKIRTRSASQRSIRPRRHLTDTTTVDEPSL